MFEALCVFVPQDGRDIARCRESEIISNFLAELRKGDRYRGLGFQVSADPEEVIGRRSLADGRTFT